ncbi:hypothetical protein HNW13_017855 [Shewanella sp. BF02_Schw]|uniref:hypothetical protein n=1 Tax=Shewanella sp. BF02_Schw TaxID=394908 RepID=UPI001781FDBC|nr:hypothetical protein [Shewanella sp. BF02_Schw]MBO1897604.1 hypothetical protein [Shewanella sp. BF02_Schw]
MSEKEKPWVLYFLFVVFFWAGTESQNPDINPWLYVKDLAGLALSMSALYLANKALFTWKAQHAYCERYRTIVELINLATECKENIDTLRHRNISIVEYVNTKNSEWKPIAEAWPSASHDLHHSSIQLQSKVNRAKFFLSEEDFKQVKSFQQKLLLELVPYRRTSQDIYKTFTDIENEVDHRATSDAYRSSERIAPKVHSPLGELLNYLGTLIEEQKVKS